MDRLVDHLFIFEGDGLVRDFPGNYSQYRLWQKEQELPLIPNYESSEKKNQSKETRNRQQMTNTKRQLSFHEKREFELLEKEIADLNKEKETITEKLNSGNAPFGELQNLSYRIGEVTRLLDEKELRWLELSEAL